METKDAWILLAGTMLGFVASLLATFTAPSIGSAFDRLKSGFIERNKARALFSYAEVLALKTGKVDKYLFAINSWGFVVIYMLLFVTGAIVGSLTSSALPLSVFLAGLATLLAARRMVRLLITLNRIADFENYRAKLLRRWPDIVLPE